jgi:hypothetical protein
MDNDTRMKKQNGGVFIESVQSTCCVPSQFGVPPAKSECPVQKARSRILWQPLCFSSHVVHIHFHVIPHIHQCPYHLQVLPYPLRNVCEAIEASSKTFFPTVKLISGTWLVRRNDMRIPEFLTSQCSSPFSGCQQSTSYAEVLVLWVTFFSRCR